MTASDLRALITSAWADVGYPGDAAIAYDNTGRHLECNQVRDFFCRKRWEEISHPVLRTYAGDESACLSFMSPVAFRYYLPAYMLVAIDHYDDADVTANSAVNALIPQTSKGLAEFWTDRTSGFSDHQKGAIVAFLSFMEGNHGSDYLSHGPKQALQYWNGAA
jgi:hypothetical protein